MRTEFAWLHARWQQKSLLNLFGFCALNHASSRTAPPSNASSTPRDDWAFASNRPFHSFGISWAWQKRIKAAPPAASTQPSPLIKRQPHPSNCPAPAMGLRLLAAALLAATAHGACEACMKYLDATWGGRGPYACNDTWAAAQGYDACPPPKTCDFALAQQGDDTCKHIYPAAAGELFSPKSGTARCQESGCCNSTRDS